MVANTDLVTPWWTIQMGRWRMIHCLPSNTLSDKTVMLALELVLLVDETTDRAVDAVAAYAKVLVEHTGRQGQWHSSGCHVSKQQQADNILGPIFIVTQRRSVWRTSVAPTQFS